MIKKRKRGGVDLFARWWALLPPDSKKRIFAFVVVLLSSSVVVGGVVFGIYSWLGQSDFFQITSIKINGCEAVDKNIVLKLSGLTIHSNLLALDTESIKGKIETHAWIDRVDLEKKWPSRLLINVKERRPQALLNTRDGLFYVDKMGDVFAAVLESDIDFPVITGLEDGYGAEDEKLDQEAGRHLAEALRFIRYAQRGSSALPGQNISELHISDDDMLLFLVDRPFPIHLGSGMSRRKYYRLAKVLYWLYKKKEFPAVEYIRMDYTKNKVLVGKK